jgi:small neutral amino acid transporter SnatA (MarC family)
MSHDFISSVLLLLMLLNPFLLIIYLLDLVQDLEAGEFSRVLFRAGVISSLVFSAFALLGDVIFEDLLQARFASFQIFGGVIFLLIGIQFVFKGPGALRNVRGAPEHIAGSIAMPIMIGPGTVSASILAGSKLPALLAVGGICGAVALTVLVMTLLKRLHDFVKPRNERLIERYVEVMGRITALVVGTFSIEMIMQGLESWLGSSL